jgi:uncharacterized coiled-coil DUF342 family protein
MNTIDCAILREIRLDVIHGIEPRATFDFTEILELVEDACKRANTSSLDELSATIEELKEESDKVDELEADLEKANEERDELADALRTLRKSCRVALKRIREGGTDPLGETDLFKDLAYAVDDSEDLARGEAKDRLTEAKQEIANLQAKVKELAEKPKRTRKAKVTP